MLAGVREFLGKIKVSKSISFLKLDPPNIWRTSLSRKILHKLLRILFFVSQNITLSWWIYNFELLSICGVSSLPLFETLLKNHNYLKLLAAYFSKVWKLPLVFALCPRASILQKSRKMEPEPCPSTISPDNPSLKMWLIIESFANILNLWNFLMIYSKWHYPNQEWLL